MTAVADVAGIPPHPLRGSCFLASCPERATGYVAGSDPTLLVCPDHTPEVERAADYTVVPIPPRRRRSRHVRLVA
jgi:hypothetical protein